MKEKTLKDYKGRPQLVLESKLNKKNRITAKNAQEVVVFKNILGILQSKESGLKYVDRKSRKTMKIYGGLHLKSNMGKLCIKRKKGAKDLM